MQEKTYGEQKILFGVIENPGGLLEIRVYHDNQSERAKITQNQKDPAYFLKHYLQFSGTNPRARYWLAQVVKDFRRYFEASKVRFVMRAAELPNELPNEFPYDAFLSYSHRDATWVRGVLLPKLTDNGLRVCIDVHDFALGAPLITEIERAIVQSRKTLLVLTPDYLTSQWTEFEHVLVATRDPAARDRRLLPLILKPTELPLSLRALTSLDFSGGGDETFLWQRLLSAFRPGPAPAPPVAVKTPLAGERPLGSISAASRVRSTLTMAQRALTILEEQAAAHTALSLPVHMRIELEEKRSEVARLEAQLQALGG